MHRWKSGASVGQVFVEDKGKTWLLQGISPLDALRPLEEASHKIGCIGTTVQTGLGAEDPLQLGGSPYERLLREGLQ